jgi:hypothetical protein
MSICVSQDEMPLNRFLTEHANHYVWIRWQSLLTPGMFTDPHELMHVILPTDEAEIYLVNYVIDDPTLRRSSSSSSSASADRAQRPPPATVVTIDDTPNAAHNTPDRHRSPSPEGATTRRNVRFRPST